MFKDFQKWQESFTNNWGGYIADKDWLDRVDAAHIKLRGGEEFQSYHQFKLKKQQRPARGQKISDIYESLIDLVPTLGKLGDLTEEKLRYPSISTANHRVFKTSKCITEAAASYYDEYTIDGKKKLDKINKLVSQLGEEWSKCRTSEITYDVIFDTSAKGFVKLGHYGPDKSSCFKQGSASEKNKYHLAQTPHTFVVTIYTDEICVARCWGFVNEDYNILNYCNLYLEKGTVDGNIFEVLRHLSAEKMSNIEAEQLHFVEGQIDVTEVFQNKFGNFSFSASKDIPKQILTVNRKYIRSEVHCDKCDRGYTNKDNFVRIDGQTVCPYCSVHSTNICDYNGCKTFKNVESVIDGYGKQQNITSEILRDIGFIKICKICSKKYKGGDNLNNLCKRHMEVDNLVLT